MEMDIDQYQMQNIDPMEVYRMIAAELEVARNAPDDGTRIEHLTNAEAILFCTQEIGTVLDNFINDFLLYMEEGSLEVKLFILSFIEKAFQKDPSVLKKTNATLIGVMREPNPNPILVKKIILQLTRIYPMVLQWLGSSANDNEAPAVWDSFSILKSRIMQMTDSKNEGIRVYMMRFIETIIISQTSKTELSDLSKLSYDMSLNQISRGHRFISYRQLESEATMNFKVLIEDLNSPKTSLLHLLSALTAVARIARARPEFVHQMIEAFESLHQNLPPTLGTGQVKSVRKELKNNLLRLLKHPAVFTKHLSKVQGLLQELGATSGEISRNMPAPSELNAALKKRVEAANAQKRAESVVSGPLLKKLRLDEEDYDDQKTASAFDDQEEAIKAQQKAVEMTTEWIMERMGGDVIPKLVFINLLTMPDEMPPAFNANYYKIPEVLTEDVKKSIARILAKQFTREGKGPGANYFAEVKKKFIIEKQKAKQSGVSVAPTPMDLGANKNLSKSGKEEFKAPVSSKKKATIKFDIFAETNPLDLKESRELRMLIFKRLMETESSLSHPVQRRSLYKSLIYMVARRSNEHSPKLEEQLMNFVIADQEKRADLIFLWLTELYNQWKGFSICVRDGAESVTFSEAENHQRYDSLLVNILSKLFAIEGHKDNLFHRIFVEAIVITQGALGILRKACLDVSNCQLAMSTLRELILTRNRQRHDFLKMMLELSYVDQDSIRFESIATTKELFEVPYVQAEVREYLREMCDKAAEKSVPPLLVIASSGFENIENTGEEEVSWDENYARSALTLVLHMIPLDTSLIDKLCHVLAAADQKVKKFIIGSVKANQISINDDNLLYAIDNCPPGGEPLIARFVTLLTDRVDPTPELVERLKNLVARYNSDVRALIPILSGMSKEECLDLVPQFVLNPSCMKSVPTFYRKILRSTNPQTKQPLVTVNELIMKLHSIQDVNKKAATILQTNIDVLVVDKANEFLEECEKIPAAIEALSDLPEINHFVFHSIERLFDKYPALGPSISKTLLKCSKKKPWKTYPEAWEGFKSCIKSLGVYGFSALVFGISWDEFRDIADEKERDPALGHKLKTYISTLSAHEQQKIDRRIIEFVKSEIAKEDKISKKSKKGVPELTPECVYKGFEGAPSAILVVDEGPFEEESIVIIGTLQGTLEVIDLWKTENPILIFEKKEIHINALVLQKVLDAKIYFYTQFRGEEIILFELQKIDTGRFDLKKVKNIQLNHCGFAKCIYDTENRRLIAPSKNVGDEAISFHYENSGEKLFSLESSFLFYSFKKNHPETELKPSEVFKGAISGLFQIDEKIQYESRDRILVGFEDCTLSIFDFRTKEIVDLFKAPAKFSQLICFAVCKSTKMDKTDKWTVAVSVCERIFEVVYESQKLELTKKIKKTGFAGVNCSQIAFNSVGDQLICGFSSGNVEIYSVPDYEIHRILRTHESQLYCLLMKPIKYFGGKVSVMDSILIGDEDKNVSQTKIGNLYDELFDRC
ncbi:hypothetical protein FO519_003839 [Halicephalobus sp. NKZ332]|nr:hypothetical protein FO519_003839 [Halicephalobus sp. NKZ332]